MPQDLEALSCDDDGLCPGPKHGTVPASKIIEKLTFMPLPLPWDGNTRLIDRPSLFEFMIISRAFQSAKLSKVADLALTLTQDPPFGKPSRAHEILQALATRFAMPDQCVIQKDEGYQLRIPSPSQVNTTFVYDPASTHHDAVRKLDENEYQIPCPAVDIDNATCLMAIIFCLGNSLSVNSIQQLDSKNLGRFRFQCTAALLSKPQRQSDPKIPRLKRVKDLPIPGDESDDEEQDLPAFIVVERPPPTPVTSAGPIVRKRGRVMDDEDED